VSNVESNHFDVIIAGAGVSGITSAAAAASRGLSVALVSTGPGSFVLGAGCVEVQNMDRTTPSLEEAIEFFRNFTELAGCGFRGGIGEKRYIPTILGSFQTVSLAPFYMWNGDPSAASQVAVVGIKGLSSFDSNFVAERLAFHASKLERGSTYISHEIELSTEADTIPGTLQFGNRYDRDLRFREELRDALKPIAAKTNLIILPGILGLKSGQSEIEWMEKELGCMLCELPTLPPSIPGMRLFNRLEARLRKIGVELFTGFPIQQLRIENGHCKGVLLETPARPLRLSSDTLILATGPFSGKLLGTSSFSFNHDLHPVDSSGAIIADNLFAAGAILRNSSARGGNAMAILTGYIGGMLAAGVGVQYAQR
jgi:glycerol-3-phosphate dehydrogenase subunit B